MRLRLDLAVVSLTLASGTAVGEGRATLFSCQVGQWKGEVTVVISTLPTYAISERQFYNILNASADPRNEISVDEELFLDFSSKDCYLKSE